MTETPSRLTPMFEQYLRIKQDYPDALLFFRMGDFYELFFSDAEVAARELQIALTSRNPQAPDPVPMCGVPWHSAENYISQLLNKGYNVAICEQLEDPKSSKGLVERGVVRVHTPATAVEDSSLKSKDHLFLAAFFWNEQINRGGLAWADVSTGYWTGIYLKKQSDAWQWIQKIAPRELLLPEGFSLHSNLHLPQSRIVRLALRSHFDLKRSLNRILSAQGVKEAHALGLENKNELIQALGSLIAYIEQTQMQDIKHFWPFSPLDPGRYLILDEVTERNLELFRQLDGHKKPGSLRHVIDATLTPMGGRLLEESLRRPLRELYPIINNQEAVAWLVKHEKPRTALRDALKSVYDLERLSTRIAMNRTSPKDFLALRQSLSSLPHVRKILLDEQKTSPTDNKNLAEDFPGSLADMLHKWDDLDDLLSLLDKSLVDEPPALITEGGLFRYGYNNDLDELLNLAENGEVRLKELLAAEQKSSGLGRLKLGYNKVFGHYFELTRAGGANLPEHFIRRQSLANAERFTTNDLSALEEKLKSAQDKRKQMEYELFCELRQKVSEQRPRIIFMAELLARLDYLQSLAHVAVKWGWTRPELNDGTDISIVDGRHPVVEAIMGKASFVPNDLRMDENRRTLLITGPNMSGKSTILRQTALICILAQMGSFVPASSAKLGICDRIFSRVGASDNLARGQSTFMVEMMETARILRQAGRKSLIILDEIGRGTSTFDGLAIAWAVVEDIAGKSGIRTLFATHYHELTALEGLISGLHSMNVAIREWKGEIVFLRRLIPGPSDRSYGIEVARLAGVPQNVVNRARKILAELEQKRGQTLTVTEQGLLPGMTKPEPVTQEPVTAQPVVHPVLVCLNDLEPESLTPLEALKILCEWKTLWGNGNEKH